jgi:hypothetical protein
MSLPASRRSWQPAWIAAGIAALAALVALDCMADVTRPDEAFDARCAQLAAPRFEVIEVPLTYVQDGSQTIDQLTVKSGHTPTTHLTFGLTTVSFGYQGDTEIGVVEDTETKQVCGTLNLQVTLSMQPVVVFLAQELASSPCAQAVTLEHEMKHVAVFRQVLADAARDLRSDIVGAFGRQIRRANNRDELERTANARVRDYLSDFIHRWQRRQDERQAAVDSPAEHERVKNACPATG